MSNRFNNNNLLSHSDITALVDAVKGHQLEFGVMLGIIYGMRRSEISVLRWRDIDLEADTIIIKGRVYPLVTNVREKIRAIYQEQKRSNVDGQYVYTNEHGERITPDYLTKAFPEFMVNNGFRKIRFYDLRVVHANLLRDSDVSAMCSLDWTSNRPVDYKITESAYAPLCSESM